MAVEVLQANSADTKCNEFERLFAAWQHAKANWYVQSYAPENYIDGLPAELDDELLDASTDALNAFLLHPCGDVKELARKLRVFRDEEIHHGWHRVDEIVSQLSKDAHRLAFGDFR